MCASSVCVCVCVRVCRVRERHVLGRMSAQGAEMVTWCEYSLSESKKKSFGAVVLVYTVSFEI